MCPREWSSWGLVARYWKDPHRFMPERFLGDWPKDAFIPFSQGKSPFVVVLCHHYSSYFPGARACLGRRCVLLWYNRNPPSRRIFRFFETEGLAIMTMLVSKYSIEIKEEPQFAGETSEERYARIMACDQAVTTV